MEQIFYPIQITSIEKPIQEATTLSFKIPDELLKVFEFKAGQHLSIRFIIDGREEKRMYSLHNSPYEKANYQITAKIKGEGLVSNHIAQNLKVGDRLEVSSPEGNFTILPIKNCCKTHYFFVAGSGITPVFSMIKTILLRETRSKIKLLYGNRNITDIIFYDEINKWKKEYPERLHVTHSLSKRFLDTSLIQEDVNRGRINDDMVAEFINEHRTEIVKSEFYICGPGGMNQMVFETLSELGIPSKLIQYEYFSAEGVEYKDVQSAGNIELNAIIRNQNYNVVLSENETILQGLKRVGAPVPFSCQNGICGTCKTKLTNGKVEMKSSMALSLNDKKQNYILACQSLAQSTVVKVDFE
ncbi:2Fe-2S iron-sulfur cluster binding domain-containing protein [Marinifilum sp. N1E240]|uniref:2Fe-2S iron-sulfur cluster-binding protein n=1 Tax=Marinifilum sp. N1E240 TaxID=2608082 RepID=UPI00128B2D2C|nr:2Fe-2S iron-sulfur cluster-binding protein [Marinifilum sp. N1E240]MPQ46353.1 2Fe-2S iron-sulfur cluster binding domain-containing protein [Marinifilum sp. N1E240]